MKQHASSYRTTVALSLANELKNSIIIFKWQQEHEITSIEYDIGTTLHCTTVKHI